MRTIMAMLALAAGVSAADARVTPSRAEAMRPGHYRAPREAAAGLGGTARLGDVTIRPLAVLEDSRCPANVECVWAGRVRLRVRISGVAGVAILISHQLFALPDGSAITLVAVSPQHWAGRPPRAPYLFTFRRAWS